VLWHNPLKGFGFGIPSILGDAEGARDNMLPAGAAAEHARQASAAAARSSAV
jgi:hypothetical protein